MAGAARWEIGLSRELMNERNKSALQNEVPHVLVVKLCRTSTMKPFNFAPIAAAVLAGVSSVQSAVVYDSLGNFSLLYPALSSSQSPTGNGGNQYLGGALNLANFTPGEALESINLRMINQSGVPIVSTPVRLNVWLWNSVPMTLSGLAFADQVGSPGAPTAVFNLGNMSLNTNSSTPVAVTFPTPVVLNPTVGTVVGITLNYEVFEGGVWVSKANVNSGVLGGGSQAAPLIGSNPLGSSPNFAFFRSVNTPTDTTGNFSTSSSRNIGVNSGLPITLVTVPEPGTTTLAIGAAALVLTIRRRNA